MSATGLRGILTSPTHEDLASLRDEIQRVENELDGLRSLERIVVTRLREEHKEALSSPDRPSKTLGRKPSQETVELRARIRQYLELCGSARPTVIAKDMGEPLAKIHNIIRHSWFAQGPRGWTLSDAGRSIISLPSPNGREAARKAMLS